jgi:hypothetical protein
METYSFTQDQFQAISQMQCRQRKMVLAEELPAYECILRRAGFVSSSSILRPGRVAHPTLMTRATASERPGLAVEIPIFSEWALRRACAVNGGLQRFMKLVVLG